MFIPKTVIFASKTLVLHSLGQHKQIATFVYFDKCTKTLPKMYMSSYPQEGLRKMPVGHRDGLCVWISKIIHGMQYSNGLRWDYQNNETALYLKCFLRADNRFKTIILPFSKYLSEHVCAMEEREIPSINLEPIFTKLGKALIFIIQ